MKKIFLLAAITLALAACDNNEDSLVSSPVAAKISATIGESTLSRAVDDSWAKGDQIGISSTVGSVVGPYINLKYTTKDGDGQFKGTELFFYKPMTLTAYYPFVGEEGKAPASTALSKLTLVLKNRNPTSSQTLTSFGTVKQGWIRKTSPPVTLT